MSEEELIQLIQDAIVANGNKEITADVLRPILIDIIEQLNANVGDLSQLNTIDQSSIVNALNEAIQGGLRMGFAETFDELEQMEGSEGVLYVVTNPPSLYLWNSTSNSYVDFPSGGGGGLDNRFNSFEEIGITTGEETFDSIQDNLPQYSTLSLDNRSGGFANIYPTVRGSLEIVKNIEYLVATWVDRLTQTKYIGYYSFDGWKGWRKLWDESNLDPASFATNVKEFGAVGDGVTDDTQAIQDALDFLREDGGGRLYFPKGIYMISGTIYIPTDVEVFGQGKGLSIIRALPTASFDLIVPYLNNTIEETDEKVKFLPMAVTDTTNYDAEGRVENVLIHDIGFDYNGVEVGSNSATEIIMGRADNSHLWEVKLFDCLPENLNNTSNKNLGSCLLFAFSEDCSIQKSIIGASDYESVSVWYLSKRITVEVTFDIDKPSTFAPQDHAIQLARPTAVADALLAEFGEQRAGPLFIYDSTFNMRRGVQSGVTSHTGDGLYVKRGYFKSFATNEQLWGIKPFDYTDNFEVSDNVFDFREKIDSDLGLSAIGLNGTIGLDQLNGSICDNTIKISNPSKASVTLKRPVIGVVDKICNNTKVSNNTIEIYDYENKDFKAIAINGVGNQVTDNKTFWINPVEEITETGPVALYVGESEDNLIEGNLSYGDTIAKGIHLDESKTIGRSWFSNNHFPNSLDELNTHPNNDLHEFNSSGTSERTEKIIDNTTQYTILAEDVDKILKFTANGGEEIQLIYNENTLPDVNKSIVAMSTGDNYLIPTVGTEEVEGTVAFSAPNGSLLRTTGENALLTLQPKTGVNDLVAWGSMEAEPVSGILMTDQGDGSTRQLSIVNGAISISEAL